MSNWLYRIGRRTARHRYLIVAGWVLIALTAIVVNKTVDAGTVDDFEVPGVESQEAIDLLDQRFPQRSGATALVVFNTTDGSVTDASNSSGIEATVSEIRALPHVLAVTDPLTDARSVSSDGSTAFAAVQFDDSAAELGSDTLEALLDTAAPAEDSGVQVEYGGELPTILKERTTGPAEAIGIVAALIILFIAFRSTYAAVLPLGTAVLGLAVGLSVVGLLGAIIDIPSVAPRLGTMIGLGVGIDYALFVLSRHRDNLRAGVPGEESIALTNATAGQAVVVAGGTVVIAILGLQLAGIPFVAALGYSASLVVAVAVLVAVTLLPALLAMAGPRVLTPSERSSPDRAEAEAHALAGSPTGTDPSPDTLMDGGPGGRDLAGNGATEHGGWIRWAHWVAYHPWRSSIAATLVLLVLAVPMLDMRLGQADAGTDPTSTTQRRAYDLLASGFGDGFNGPLLLVVETGPESDPDALEQITMAVMADPGVRAVSPPELNPTGDTAVITAIPTTAPQDVATSELVHRLRDDVLPSVSSSTGTEVLIGGPTASFIDQSDRISARLPWFIGAVVALSFLLLMTVFRSLLVPLKAAILNLLSIGAAYGVVVAVFQWGWGLSLIGLEETVPIASFVPMMMFAILFGLSMDYEVFILSRIREEYHQGKSNIDSVVAGLGATANVVTAAALIMVSVFLGFVASDDPVVKMMGVGLATAVAVDATIVRMVLVPATMALVGDPNWWLPSWLDRLLPSLDIEAEPVPEAGTPS